MKLSKNKKGFTPIDMSDVLWSISGIALFMLVFALSNTFITDKAEASAHIIEMTDDETNLIQYLKSPIYIDSSSKSSVSTNKIHDFIAFADPRIEIKDIGNFEKSTIKSQLEKETISFFDSIYGKNNWEIRIFYPDLQKYQSIGQLIIGQKSQSQSSKLPSIDGKIISVFLVVNK